MLISTKTQPPQLKANLLERQHLIDRLNIGGQSQLITITGPAGYGKTSLAVQWIKQLDGLVSWYSIDEPDNDVDLFFRYFMTALINCGNGLKKELNSLLLDPNQITADDVIPSIIHALGSLSQEMIVAFDDYHLITNDAVHHALARLLKYIPSHIHILIISRHFLPQPLERVKLQQDVTEISVQGLKFSEAEATLFFKKVIPLKLSQKQIKVLTRINRGWVTGFQIFGLWQKNRKLMAQPKGLLKIAGRESVDYLINEVVNSQPEKIKTFLYQTAGLSRLNADICRHVTGFSDTEKILVDLHRQHLFIIPLDPEHTWYRYHHLFSQALRVWLKRSSPGLLEQTRKQAAIWCIENQFTEEAFQYASASGDFEYLADLLENHIVSIWVQFEAVSYLRWLSKLPKDIFLKRPLLRLVECEFKINRMKLDEASGILIEIESQLKKTTVKNDTPEEADTADYLAYLKLKLACYQDISKVDIQKAIKEIEKISPRNKLMSIMIVVKIFLSRGDPVSAERELTKASEAIFIGEYMVDRMDYISRRAEIERMKGRLRRSEKILLDGLHHLKQEKLADTPIKYLLHFHMAMIFYQRNELDTALTYATPGLGYIERTGNVESIWGAYFLLFTIWMAKGDLNKATHYAQKSKALSESLDVTSNVDYTEEMYFLLSIRKGDVEAMEKRIASKKPNPSEPFSMKIRLNTRLLAVSLFYKGKLYEASRVLESLRKQCIKRNMFEFVLDIDVYLSGIYFLMGKKEAAVSIMEKAIKFSEKEGYIRPFAGNAGLILPLLTDLKDRSKKISRSVHFKSLLKACDPPKAQPPESTNESISKNAFDLTQRECEILQFISNGYTNKQIADMAFISLSTVKTHIQHIFKKLDVKSRTQAALKSKAFLPISQKP